MSDVNHEKINYVELPSSNIKVTQEFYAKAFGWQFEDFGDEYSTFSGAGLDGGFYLAPVRSCSNEGAALIVLFSETLEITQRKIIDAGGCIVKEIFKFPGGRRFHFTDITGNELAVWSDR